MKTLLSFTVLLTCLLFNSQAQNILQAEYYFDTDPGVGNGIPVVITSPGDSVSQVIPISLSGLPAGPHHLVVRVKDSLGRWSHQLTRTFFVLAPPLPPQGPVVSAEYFIDADPGTGNGTAVSFAAPSDTVSQPVAIPMTSLLEGPHLLCLRTKNAEGRWSHQLSRAFFVRPDDTRQQIIAAEYFIDSDPGIGNGIPVAVPQGDSVDASILATNPHASGQHILMIRTKDAGGQWSHQLAARYKVCATYGPESDFDYVVNRDTVYFQYKALYAQAHKWNFGFGQTDTLKFNPSHIYPSPGIYYPSLVTYNACDTDTLVKPVQINGLISASPKIAMPNSLVLMDVIGFGFTANSQFKLWRPGFTDIPADSAQIGISGNSARLDFILSNAAPGMWNLVVSGSGIVDTLYDAIKIDTSITSPQLEVYLKILNVVRRFRTNIFTISVTNKGNIPVYGIPVIIENTKASATIISLTNPFYDNFLDSAALSLGTPTRFYYNIDSLTNDTNQIGAFLIPYIPAGETHFIQLKYRTTSYGTDYISVIVKNPLLDSTALSLIGLNRSMGNCTWIPPCLQAALDGAGMVPGLGCAVGLFDLACAVGNYANDFDEGKPTGNTLMDLSLATGGTMISCLTGLPGRQILRFINSLSKFAYGFNSGTIGNGPLKKCWDDIDGSSHTEGVTAFDPNLKSGLNGYAAQNYISDRGPISYSISFENADTASAPAAEVILLDTLDKTKLDLRTFRFDRFEIADSIYHLDFPVTRFVREIDLRPSKNTILRVSGSLDSATGVILSRFSSYDPDTLSIVSNPLDGFLPPNISKPEGEGSVSFYCSLLPSVSNLDVINNKAEILFDQNAPIQTPVWFNTLDLNPPSSAVQPLSPAVNDSSFTVRWSGTDGESGVKQYNVYVSVNDSAYVLWQVRTPLDSAVFPGQNGVQYEFYSVAVDSVNNIEDPPANAEINPDAVTSVVVNTLELLAGYSFEVSPNPASDFLHLLISTKTPKDFSVTLYNMQGARQKDWTVKANRIEKLSLENFPSGMYYLKASADEKSILIKKIILIR